ncbi:MAG: hypothetical protein A2W90_24215 [Bacteroidetes bacterium GWF2_42_66]|nr:MAG: hypothetical protein A2W89_07885 [Bacteroidetes bacterium GWE2_42_39]OFY45795.1 MAG: hypothetical protein A2W90_24215 [Bacteroidetes bacterium GWF2_42_66]HBL74705.1 hypothetical protein [Prolixibacteraceae bacterium]HCU60788.1 hypothetical protein [Prolixibacteraceae bacterium]
MSKFLSFVGFLLISSTLLSQPVQYYNNAEGKKGDALKSALHTIISGHVDYSYNNAKYLLNYCDADPANPANVILLYTQRSQSSDTYGTGGDYINREHVWAKSHGDFADIRPMDSDVHNLHPADASVNQIRSNRDFDKVSPNGTQAAEAPGTWYNTNAWEPSDAVKGQVARAILYMDVRYEGTNGEMNLTAVNGTGTYPQPQHGNLQALLEWNRQFPPTNFERRRNERVFNMQLNRNPFVDYPEYADLIWGSSQAPTIQITGNSILPEIPIEGNTVQFKVSVSSANQISSVVVYWGKSYNSEEKSATMTASGNNYQAEMSLSGFSGGQYLYYKVVATDAAQNQRTRHFSAFIHKNISKNNLTSLAAIQGTQEVSPMVNQTVIVSGRVSKIIDGEYFIQNNGQREAICIYTAPETGAIGDSVVISGTVTEYNNLTEIKDITYFCNLKNNKPVVPLEIKTSDVNENLEGKLVSFKNVTFSQAGTTIPSDGGTYTFSDGYGSFPLYVNYSSKLVGQKIPTGTNTVTGIIGQYKTTYQLIARDINDLKSGTNSVIPELASEEKPFRIFPNPVYSGKIKIQAKPSSVESFAINDLSGRTFLSGEIDSEIKLINVSGLPAGIYFVVFRLNDGSTGTCKLLKN